MKPIHISKLINRELGKNSLYWVIKNWHKIVGNIIFKVAAPVKIKNNTLLVGVKNHQWLQELSFSKETMLKKVCEYSRDVKDIQFILRSDIRKPSQAALERKKAREQRIMTTLTAKDLEFIGSAVASVKDEELREIFESLLRTKIHNGKSTTEKIKKD